MAGFWLDWYWPENWLSDSIDYNWITLHLTACLQQWFQQVSEIFLVKIVKLKNCFIILISTVSPLAVEKFPPLRLTAEKVMANCHTAKAMEVLLGQRKICLWNDHIQIAWNVIWPAEKVFSVFPRPAANFSQTIWVFPLPANDLSWQILRWQNNFPAGFLHWKRTFFEELLYCIILIPTPFTPTVKMLGWFLQISGCRSLCFKYNSSPGNRILVVLSGIRSESAKNLAGEVFPLLRSTAQNLFSE